MEAARQDQLHEVQRVAVASPRLAERQKLDGCYVLQTDLTPAQLNAQGVHARYKDLALVEWAFRTSKPKIRYGGTRTSRPSRVAHGDQALYRQQATRLSRLLRRLARSASAPRRACSPEEETTAKTQNPLILQRITGRPTSGFCWNIRYKRD